MAETTRPPSDEIFDWKPPTVFMHVVSVFLGAYFHPDGIGFFKTIGAALMGYITVLIIFFLIKMYPHSDMRVVDALRKTFLVKLHLVSCIMSNGILICIFATLIARAEVRACHFIISIGDNIFQQDTPILAFIIKVTAALVSMIPWITMISYLDLLIQNNSRNQALVFTKGFPVAIASMALNIPCAMAVVSFGTTLLSSEFSPSVVGGTASAVGTAAFGYMCVVLVPYSIGTYLNLYLGTEENDRKKVWVEDIDTEIKNLQRIIDERKAERRMLGAEEGPQANVSGT